MAVGATQKISVPEMRTVDFNATDGFITGQVLCA